MRKLDPSVLAEYIQGSGLKFRVGPQSYIFTCPRCNKKDRLYVRKRDGRFRCMKCGPDFQGYAETALAELLATQKDDVELSLYGGIQRATETGKLPDLDFADHWGTFGFDGDDDEEYLVVDSLPPEIYFPPDFYELDAPISSKASEYLSRRGVSIELAQAYKLKFHPMSNRIIIPVIVEGLVRGWQGRYVGETEYFVEEEGWKSIPKILTYGEIGGRCLMFQDNLKNSKHAILTEGPFDGIKCHRCAGNVASMGKGITKKQLDIILKSGIEKLYIGLDPDAADDIERVSREALQAGIECYRLDPPAGKKDLGDATLDEVYDLFRSAPRIKGGQLFIYLKPLAATFSLF